MSSHLSLFIVCHTEAQSVTSQKRWATFQAGLWGWLIFIEKQLKGSTLESYHSTLLPNTRKIYWQVPLRAGPCPLKTFLAEHALGLEPKPVHWGNKVMREREREGERETLPLASHTMPIYQFPLLSHLIKFLHWTCQRLLYC